MVVVFLTRQLRVPLGISANLHVAVEALLVGDLSSRCGSLLRLVRGSGCILRMLFARQAIKCFLVLYLKCAHLAVAFDGHRLRDVGLIFVVCFFR